MLGQAHTSTPATASALPLVCYPQALLLPDQVPPTQVTPNPHSPRHIYQHLT